VHAVGVDVHGDGGGSLGDREPRGLWDAAVPACLLRTLAEPALVLAQQAPGRKVVRGVPEGAQLVDAPVVDGRVAPRAIPRTLVGAVGLLVGIPGRPGLLVLCLPGLMIIRT